VENLKGVTPISQKFIAFSWGQYFLLSPLHVLQWRLYIISSGLKLNQNSNYSCSLLIGDYAQAPTIYT